MNTAPLSASFASLHDLHGADADVDLNPAIDEDPDAAPPLPRDALRLVMHLVSGLNDRRAAPLAASYGVQANLSVDFATRSVRLDPAAARRLDARQELPLPVRQAAPAQPGHPGQPAAGARPGSQALTRDLDDVVWDIGMACRGHRLPGAGRDAWQQPLLSDAATPMRRLLRLPLPLALARLMFAADGAAFTPARVQRACGLSVQQTRGLLHACLLLGLVRWDGAARAARPLPPAGPVAAATAGRALEPA